MPMQLKKKNRPIKSRLRQAAWKWMRTRPYRPLQIKEMKTQRSSRSSRARLWMHCRTTWSCRHALSPIRRLVHGFGKELGLVGFGRSRAKTWPKDPRRASHRLLVAGVHRASDLDVDPLQINCQQHMPHLCASRTLEARVSSTCRNSEVRSHQPHRGDRGA